MIIKKKSFTLLEVILAIGLISFLFLSAFTLLPGTLGTNQGEETLRTLTKSLLTAQNNAIVGFLDSDWGVRVQNNNIIIFSGNTYATRNPANDIVLVYSDKILITGLTEVVFSETFGETSNTGTLLVSGNNFNKTLNINAKGVLF